MIRVAIDLRFAQSFSSILKECGGNAGVAGSLLNIRGENGSGRGISIRERLRERAMRGLGGFLNGGRSSSYSDPDINSLNMLLTSNSELLMMQSPCRLHFSFNSSEFHEGADLHLLKMMLDASSLLDKSKQN